MRADDTNDKLFQKNFSKLLQSRKTSDWLGAKPAAHAWCLARTTRTPKTPRKEWPVRSARHSLAICRREAAIHSRPCRILAVLGVLGVLAARLPMKFLAGGPVTGMRQNEGTLPVTRKARSRCAWMVPGPGPPRPPGPPGARLGGASRLKKACGLRTDHLLEVAEKWAFPLTGGRTKAMRQF